MDGRRSCRTQLAACKYYFAVCCYRLILALASAAYLNILQLGDEMARGLGVNVEVTRIILTAIAALLAASAVSVVGLLGFVGLVVPHARDC